MSKIDNISANIKTPALTLAEVYKLSPCEDSYRRVSAILPKRRKINAAQAREAGCTFNDIIWVATAVARKNAKTMRLLQHWLADCASRALHIYERKNPGDSRPRNAIQARRDFADGHIDDAELEEVLFIAEVAALTAFVETATQPVTEVAALTALVQHTTNTLEYLLFFDEIADTTEKAWQFDRLIYWLTEEAPQPLELPEMPSPRRKEGNEF